MILVREMFCFFKLAGFTISLIAVFVTIGRAAAPPDTVLDNSIHPFQHLDKHSVADSENSVKNTVLSIGSVKQLFIDDYIIDNTTHISKVLNQGNKILQPVLESDMPWEKDVCLYGSVIKEDGIFKMWYRAISYYDKSYLCYATSIDGINWFKPNLGLYTLNNSTNNNIIMEGLEIFSIIKNPNPLSNRKYLLYGYNANSLCYETRWSADGVSYFYKIATHMYTGDVCNMVYDKSLNEYIVTYKIPSGGPSVYKREFYTSTTTDLINFTNGVKMYTLADSIDIQTVPGTLRVDCYGMGILPYEGVYIGFDWLFYISNYNNGGGSHIGKIDVQLVFSRDIANQWQRTERKAIIPLGDINAWDSGMIVTASSPLIENNEIWMYYGAFNGLHKNRDGNIGLVKWRLDGFMSLNSNAIDEGVIETKPLIFDGTNLVLNANSSKHNAYILVELLYSNGNIIPGYSKNDCIPILTDDVNTVVSWGAGSDIGFLKNDEIKIKIYTRNSEIYALQFVDNVISNNPIFSDTETNEIPFTVFNDAENSILTINGKINNAVIKIFNVNGKLISVYKSDTEQYTIDTNSFSQGIYLLSIEGNNINKCEKFIKY